MMRWVEIDGLFGANRWCVYFKRMVCRMGVNPAFVGLFKQRWHLIGEVRGKDHPMTCALKRMKQLEVQAGKKVKSQVELAHTDDYTDFEIYVRPTYDLKQELLWHRDKLAVLSPESFRQDLISVLHATLKGYETGISHAINE